ncbi:hypothetical protein [uncultured Veillonella sp.]|uniref:hypothetical protein n=1 Tax=uncultured Veillonella sp. TaxID=159268 RepID=UPI00258D1EE9|nr:hypothetical protein [uncultured Veillonella sp.]
MRDDYILLLMGFHIYVDVYIYTLRGKGTMKLFHSRIFWETVILLGIIFPIGVYLSTFKYSINDIFTWGVYLLVTPLVWKGFTYKATGFWKTRGKIARWLWIYFMTAGAIWGIGGVIWFLFFWESTSVISNVVVILFLPLVIPAVLYKGLGFLGWELAQSMSDYIDPFMYPVLLACVRRSLYLLYFMTGTILIILVAYSLQSGGIGFSREYNDIRREERTG